MTRLGYLLQPVFIFILATACAAQADPLKIGTFPIPLMVTDQDTGVFVRLFREAAQRAGEEIGIEVHPPKRTVHLFHKGRLDGFFPALDINVGETVSKSATIYLKKDIVFVRKDSPPIRTIGQLEGKQVGLTLGYPYSEEIISNEKITKTYADSDIINMRRLSRERIGAFVVEEKSGIAALRESGVSNVCYDPDKALYEKRVFFAFQGNERGRRLAEKFSQALEEMKKDGTFDGIMSKAK